MPLDCTASALLNMVAVAHRLRLCMAGQAMLCLQVGLSTSLEI